MKVKKFPINEMTISNKIGRPVNAKIRMSNLKEFYIQPQIFLKTFSDFFDELPWEKNDELKSNQFKKIKIEFEVSLKGLRFFMVKNDDTIFPIEYFLKKDSLTKVVHHLFGSIFSQYYKFIKDELQRDFVKIEVQFIREKISEEEEMNLGNENFEGSKVIVHRENISGGESQILEKNANRLTEVIFQKELKPGDLVFIKNKYETENKYIHQFSPITSMLKNQPSWLDSLGFEIMT